MRQPHDIKTYVLGSLLFCIAGVALTSIGAWFFGKSTSAILQQIPELFAVLFLIAISAVLSVMAMLYLEQKWAWFGAFTMGCGIALVPVLGTQFIWPGWLVTEFVPHGRTFAIVAVFGLLWMLASIVRQNRRT
jgi:hypothetical protein